MTRDNEKLVFGRKISSMEWSVNGYSFELMHVIRTQEWICRSVALKKANHMLCLATMG